jgi:hypothetical protein
MKITKQTARKLYNESPDWFKDQLKEAFGKESFEKRSFKDIKTFEDACKELDISTTQVCAGDTKDEEAYKMLKIIIKAINQGWEPDWSDTNQRKWWPYFVLSSGFGFSFSYYHYGNADARVGSRLCFESQDKSDYAANQFLDLYKQFLT